MTPLKFFIGLAFLAVPFLMLAVVIFVLSDLMHSLGIIGTRGTAPNDSELGHLVFAGIVISSLLCIGIRTGAFDKLLPKEK